jgi:sodium/potassium/calcium exchanger 6
VVQSLQSTTSRYRRRRISNSTITREQQPFQPSQSNEPYTDELLLHRAESTHNDVLPRRNTSVLARFFNSTSRRYIRRQVRKHLFPTFVGFRQKSTFSKISSLTAAPVIFLLAVTLPVVRENVLTSQRTVQLGDDTAELLQDYDSDNDDDDLQTETSANNTEEGSSWVKWLTAVQLVGAPLLIAFVFITQKVSSVAVTLPVAIALGALLSVAFWMTTSASKQPRLFWMMCFIGFGIAVVWIFLIANEVVSVLQAIGMAVGASEAILGLTIFALVSIKFVLQVWIAN